MSRESSVGRVMLWVGVCAVLCVLMLVGLISAGWGLPLSGDAAVLVFSAVAVVAVVLAVLLTVLVVLAVGTGIGRSRAAVRERRRLP